MDRFFFVSSCVQHGLDVFVARCRLVNDGNCFPEQPILCFFFSQPFPSNPSLFLLENLLLLSTKTIVYPNIIMATLVAGDVDVDVDVKD